MRTSLIFCLSISFLMFLSFVLGQKSQILYNKKVSLPEEISLAKKGDILIVEKVTDSIYLGYSLEWKVYALDLEEQGYTKKASEHIAKVEFNIIPVDKEYISLMED